MRVQPLLLSTISPALAQQVVGVRSTQTVRTERTTTSSGSCDCEDSVEISAEGQKAADEASGESAANGAAGAELSPEEQQQVEELKQRDREVRAHEQAHLAAAGQYAAGGPTFTYQQGPDGQRYAIGGEVPIDTSPVEGDPVATIRKAQVIRSAANAPAEPSSQDRRVAAQASQLEAQARAELAQQQSNHGQGESAPSTPGTRLNLVA